jgi:hypothetical protein
MMCEPANLFTKDFQIQPFFLQVFPRNPLAVLGDFNDLQQPRGLFKFSKFFRPRRQPKAPRRGEPRSKKQEASETVVRIGMVCSLAQLLNF